MLGLGFGVLTVRVQIRAGLSYTPGVEREQGGVSGVGMLGGLSLRSHALLNQPELGANQLASDPTSAMGLALGSAEPLPGC